MSRRVTITCANPACRREARKHPADLRRVKQPTCSRTCRDALARIRTDWAPREGRGGRILRDGYPYQRVPRTHHLATADGYAPLHLLVAEDVLGRPLRRDERVRRLSADRTDTRPEILFVTWMEAATGRAMACALLQLAARERAAVRAAR